tara:strand:- start:19922 stop:21247 length:1326 start_codon:yes stop_codon:yes gene_type:complete
MSIKSTASKNSSKIKNNSTAVDIKYNSLNDFTSGVLQGRETSQLSKIDTIAKGNRFSPISNNRAELSAMYSTYGVAQTMVDQPVEDAYKGGIILRSDELDECDIKEVMHYMEGISFLETFKQSSKWSRLFGGAGLIINTGGTNANKPLSLNSINQHTPLTFYAADLWELIRRTTNHFGEEKPYFHFSKSDTPFFSFHGSPLHKDRVIQFKGKTAPSLLRPQLRGWGMSELERLVRSINQFIKNQEVIFELLDEAKVDIWKIQGFNSAMSRPDTTKKIVERVQMANTAKSYVNAITMDKEDEYQQKQINFAGLSEMAQEFRINIASDAKFPLTKLFGLAPNGWASREEENENYNAMVQAEVRDKNLPLLKDALKYVFKKVLDFIPEKFTVEYHPLKVMNIEQQEAVKSAKYIRIVDLLDRGIIDENQFKQQLNNGKFLDMEL